MSQVLMIMISLPLDNLFQDQVIANIVVVYMLHDIGNPTI